MRENRRRDGTRRIKASLQKSGIEVGRAVIGRLMREQGLKAIAPKSFKPKTTDSKGTKASLNLLAEIKVEECVIGKIIVGDITYVPLRHGKWCYLAMWQDKVTRAHHWLEFAKNNDGTVGHFCFAKSNQKRVD
ncbi:MAG TPA: IS3 family transposase [Pyrinomonadaceae bacterium]|jgi:transposase InsO family protein